MQTGFAAQTEETVAAQTLSITASSAAGVFLQQRRQETDYLRQM